MEDRKSPALVVLAAGLGSRFGGVKQLNPLGDQGEILLDFSVYDAILAGFRKIVFVIRKEHEADFERLIGRAIRPLAEVRYVYQSLEQLPKGRSLPEGRTKPWGTGHALLCCKGSVEEPMAVINADDYYGREAFKLLYDFLCQAQDGEQYHYAMVGYELGKTLTENGTVSRGICREDEQGHLLQVTEHTKLQREGDRALSTGEGQHEYFPLDVPVSMNMWAFTPSILSELESAFERFWEEKLPQDFLKAEFYLPAAVDALVQAGKAQVQLLRSGEQWYGVTYQQDRQTVIDALLRMKQEGKYPRRLWDVVETQEG